MCNLLLVWMTRALRCTPDGDIIIVESERFRCADVLFQSSFIGKETSGIHGTTFPFAGIGKRMTKELTALWLQKCGLRNFCIAFPQSEEECLGVPGRVLSPPF